MNVDQVYRGRPREQEQPHQNPRAFQLADPLVDQIDLFDDPDRWPRKPYCATDLERGIRPRTLKSALLHPYIQANPPHLRVWSIYDVDRPGGGLAWEPHAAGGMGLPPPAWSSINRENGHAHLVWGLRAPVLLEAADARRAPMRYLAAVEQAFSARLQADAGYSGLITKNPAHPLWRTLKGPKSAQYYDLGDLAEWVDLPKHLPKQGVRLDELGLGRNVTLFDWVRLWSYKAVRLERETRNFAVWSAKVFARALARNADFRVPLDANEVKHLAKSVAKWTWARDAQAHTQFIARQARKGQKGGIASGAARLSASEDKRSSAVLMAAKGMSQRTIARELSVSAGSINAWLKAGECSAKPKSDDSRLEVFSEA
ncbi:replication initiation protein [Polaromonas sp.]|uniref:replication initiation protein n=1 Tax=Polaromonas sp. TaxID=1869339 RepID=UPI00352AB007